MRSSLFFLLLTTAAFGADIPQNPPPPLALIRPALVQPHPNALLFEGFYAGLHAGYGFNGRFNDMTNSSVVTGGVGGLGGVRIGYDKQHMDWVFGAFAELNLVTVKAKTTLLSGMQLAGHVNYTGTLVARAGRLLAPDTLFYGLLGMNVSGFTMDSANAGVIAHETNHAFGWSVGAGVEYKINQAFSVFGEYRNANHFVKTMSNFNGAKYDVNYHALRFGVNYHY
jgi:outer membrane immunogenic protein